MSTDHHYVLAEPPDHRPVIDGEGFAWVYEDFEGDGELMWTRRVWTLSMAGPDGGRHMSGPNTCATWEDDVVWHGPIRLAVPGVDDLSWKFLYYPDGYHQGSPVGDYVVLNSPDVPQAYLLAGGK